MATSRSFPVVLAVFGLSAGVLPAQGGTPLTTVRVAAGLAAPLYVGTPSGDEGRLFIIEQNTGRIRILSGGSLLGTPFLDIGTLVLTGGERGLLGLAFHPDYWTNGYFYVNYTRRPDGHTMVVRYTVSATNINLADPGSAFTIIGPITQPFSNHNGGCVLFGPDRYLYIGMGDGGSSGDPACNAQRGNTLLGKMLRLDVDGGSPYAIPANNPFVNDPNVMDEIWSLGWRNPWRFSFDRLTGDMYVGDVGQGAREEISFQSGSSPGGENYGWKIMEGNACYSTAACPAPVIPCNDPRLVRPIHDYTHSGGACSVTGGYVYRGCAIPDLKGTYFFADYCNARIWSFRYRNGSVTDFRDRTTELAPGGSLSIASITSFGEDSRGELYIVDGGGEVFKIVPRLQAPAVDLGFGKVGGNGGHPAFDVCGLLNAGNVAEFRLRYAPPHTVAVIVLSNRSNPTPLFMGTLVPVPPQYFLPSVTDPLGGIVFDLPGGGGPFDVYCQYLVYDPGATEQVSFSNALKVTVLN